ncbi:MAG: hypothetical protein Q4F40_09920, partial [Akkermansia sp.]|nr:hypothetical protein [Akkermansia sp.]
PATIQLPKDVAINITSSSGRGNGTSTQYYYSCEGVQGYVLIDDTCNVCSATISINYGSNGNNCGYSQQVIYCYRFAY